MGDKACPIIPIPKTLRLEPSTRPWPQRFDVICESAAAEPLKGRFAVELQGTGDVVWMLRLRHRDGKPQGYGVRFGASELVCTAADAAGFRHALQTLKQLACEPNLPLGMIEDYPSLPLRGFHLNFENCRRLTYETARGLVEAAARFKINTLLVEYGPRFPYPQYPDLSEPTSLSPDQIAGLCAAAADCGIEIIPLQQSMAHLEYLLRHDRFAHLRERPDKDNLICPSNPESLALIKSLLQQMIDLHPQCKWLHIGGDEARKVGQCPRCKEIVERQGRDALIGRFLGDLARWVLEQGKRPIVWDDTLCAHPDALVHLPKETIIHYWDYIAVADPTPVLIPRMAHARGGPRVAHHWAWTLTRKRGKVSDVQAAVMKDYSQLARLRSALSADFLNEFGKYLGAGFPKWIRALPYIEYYQDRGFTVLTSPTGMGNGDMADGAPNFARFEHNIRTHAARGIENGKTLGIITTFWQDMPLEMLYHPLQLTARSAW